jgi:endonuclease YncB( thermonuclease family)
MFSVSLNQEGLIEDIKRDVAPEAAPKEVAMKAAGPARVIDGDTLEINGTSYRLSGVDAPEAGQPCKAASGLVFDCGEVARRGLEKAIGSATVTCEAETIDFFQRPVALCKSGDTDLAALMVVNGFAVPFIEYSDAYASLGDTAMKNKVGIWATTFESPAEYRKKH